MKSPTSSVGRIEDDGILNGSARNERSRKTTSSTGKNDFAYSTHTGSPEPGARRRASSTRSRSQMTPVTAVSTNRIKAKFIGLKYVSKARAGALRARGIVAWAIYL